MYKYSIYSIVAVFLLLASPVVAAEIQYGHVEDVHNDELHIQYKGPGGEQNFVCHASTLACTDFGTTTPSLFPEIDGSTGYANSPDGRYAVVGTEVPVATSSVVYLHTLYDVSGDRAEKITTLPYLEAISSYKFSWASDHVALFTESGDVLTYSIPDNTMGLITPSQSSFPLKSLSPHGRFLSAYNYSDEAHKIWHTTTGQERTIPSATPAYVEFSQSEQYAAFMDDRDGYQTLYISDLTADESAAERVFADDFTIEDYLWFKDKLYAVGNTEEDPYQWVLYQYDIKTDNVEIVADNVSYGDYIRPIGDLALSFLVTEGKNSHVALYNAEQDSVEVIRAIDASPASQAITRSVVSFADGVKGVLYEPERPAKDSALFVWLHGGPMRQTSFGYHSYLSYAVYDELLERLVENGAYVLKLDYAGSYGHGSAFMDQLSTRLGDIDVENVVDATRTITSEYDIDDSYLIGNSYGGYLGPKTLVENERLFAGAIAINGVFDWFDLLERIPSSPFKAHFEGLVDLDDLDTNFAMYEEASIVKALPELSDHKKLLLIYGEDDATVPTWQTREFFYHAKTLDKNVELLKLEGEGHIIRNRDSLTQVCQFIAEELSLSDLRCD